MKKKDSFADDLLEILKISIISAIGIFVLIMIIKTLLPLI